MILADIGNYHAHIWHDGMIEHLDISQAIEKYADYELHFISVNDTHFQRLQAMEKWTDISDEVSISGEYVGLGVDRKALCLSKGDGVYVDAGSAITVDKVVDGCYMGGFILPGVHAYGKAYADIAPVLALEINRGLDISNLPKSTKDGVSYGTISPIVSSVEKISVGMELYFTGGDGEWLSGYFDRAVYDEEMLFLGMIKIIGLRGNIC